MHFFFSSPDTCTVLSYWRSSKDQDRKETMGQRDQRPGNNSRKRIKRNERMNPVGEVVSAKDNNNIKQEARCEETINSAEIHQMLHFLGR